MKKLLILLALVAAACGTSGSVAAKVGDRSITVAEVGATTADGADGTADPAAFRTTLEFMIVEEIGTSAAAADFQIEPTDEEVQAKLAEFIAQFGGEEAFVGVAAEAGFSLEGARMVARQQLVRDTVTARLLEGAAAIDDALAQAFYDENVGQFVDEACVSHVLLASEEEALAARERIEGGEDFAAVAAELSTDPSAQTNGGDLGCAPLSGYVPEFANAAAVTAIGEVSDPVLSQFGYHIILVASRNEPTSFESVKGQIAGQLDAQRSEALFTDWIIAAAEAAVVEVDLAYGTWSTENGPQIIPPAGP